MEILFFLKNKMSNLLKTGESHGKRFDFLDGYRGTLALVVVLHHTNIILPNSGLLNLLNALATALSQKYAINYQKQLFNAPLMCWWSWQ